jgi:hypothetical protein
MKRLRDPKWALIAIFVVILAAVPLCQTLLELGGENGIGALEVLNEPPSAANLRAYEKNLEKSSWAAQLSRPWLQFVNFTTLKDGGEKVVVGSSGWYFYKPGLNYMLARREVLRAANPTNDPVTAIIDFRDQLAARGIHLLVLPVPNKESIYPDRLSTRAEGRHGVVSPRTQEIFEKLRSANVEVIDLFKEFSSARKQSESSVETALYLAQDTHWSPAGVTLAAKAVARRLVELGWVGPGPVEYAEKGAPVQRIGDLVRMLQSLRIEASIIPEPVSSVQIVRGEECVPYKDAATAEILVLGDSFMRIYQQDAPNSAGFIAHLAKELKQPMMSLVNDGGGSTLVREELAAQPVFLNNKKVVIWEFVERDLGLGIKGWQRVKVP